MKNRIAIILCLGGLLLTGGCRRTDVRQVTVKVDGLESNDVAKVNAAFLTSAGMIYDGILMDTIKCDFKAGTITLDYESMKIAQTNIRMLLESKGLKVIYPTNTTGRAGY